MRASDVLATFFITKRLASTRFFWLVVAVLFGYGAYASRVRVEQIKVNRDTAARQIPALTHPRALEAAQAQLESLVDFVVKTGDVPKFKFTPGPYSTLSGLADAVRLCKYGKPVEISIGQVTVNPGTAEAGIPAHYVGVVDYKCPVPSIGSRAQLHFTLPGV